MKKMMKKTFRTVYAKDIPKDQYSVVDSSLRTDKAKSTSVSLQDMLEKLKIELYSYTSYSNLEVMQGNAIYNTTVANIMGAYQNACDI